MNKDKKYTYPPHLRSFYGPEEQDLVSNSPNGVSSKLPNYLEDDIVSSNIACMEFDYTDNTFFDDEDY